MSTHPFLTIFLYFFVYGLNCLLLVFQKSFFLFFFEEHARRQKEREENTETDRHKSGNEGENGDLGNNKANPQPENRMTNDSNYIFSPVIMSFFMHPSSCKTTVILLSSRLLFLLSPEPPDLTGPVWRSPMNKWMNHHHHRASLKAGETTSPKNQVSTSAQQKKKKG